MMEHVLYESKGMEEYTGTGTLYRGKQINNNSCSNLQCHYKAGQAFQIDDDGLIRKVWLQYSEYPFTHSFEKKL